MTSEEQRRQEEDAIEREGRAFARRQAAWLAVHRQLLPLGNGQPSLESMDEFDAAEHEWRAAQAETNRIAQEIQRGKRS